MKIAVILTRFLKDYVESYFNSLSLDCELSYYIYNDFAHAGELYLELEKSYDGFLVSGPVPRAAICRRVPVLTKPIVSFGSNALCYYETFFQVQFKEQDFYLERGYFDLLEWLPETVPLHQYLERGQFNQLIYKVYQNTSTYSLEQLCEMEKKIKLKHIRLWNEKKIQYSVTRFSNIIQDLLDAGVNTYFVYPKYEILQESVTLLLQEIHLKTIVQNQNAITALNQQFSDGASVMAPQLSKDPDASAPLTSRSRQLSQKAGISVSYADRLLTALSAMDRDCITSQALAAALHITPRSANRLLGRLSATGIFLELERQPSFTRGRPEKIYRFIPNLFHERQDMVWNRRKWFRSNGTYSTMDYIQENSRIQQEAVSDNADNRENTKQQKVRRPGEHPVRLTFLSIRLNPYFRPVHF